VRLLDRYVLRRFFQFFVFALLASVVIFVTVDSTEHLDKFIDAKVPYRFVLYYYYLYLPYIIYLTVPVSVLLATLFAVGGLVYRNELTAMQSAGYSLWRILCLLMLVALPLSGATLVFGESVVPPPIWNGRSSTKRGCARRQVRRPRARADSIFRSGRTSS